MKWKNIFTKDLLFNLYVKQKLNTCQIAKIYNTNPTVIIGYLKRHKIPTRKKWFGIQYNISKKDLYKKYIIEKKSTTEIAEEYGVYDSTIANWLRNYNISIRNLSEAYKDNRTKKSFKKMAKTLRKGWTKEKRLKKSKEMLGEKNHMYGKKRPDTSRMNKNPKFQQKCLKGLIKKPNKPEKKLIELFKKNRLPYKYVGDGEFMVSSLNPDFINVDGQKKIIELFGDYWHNRKDIDWCRTEEGRKKIFAKYGFDTLIIWEKELNDLDKVLDKIEEFNLKISKSQSKNDKI